MSNSTEALLTVSSKEGDIWEVMKVVDYQDGYNYPQQKIVGLFTSKELAVSCAQHYINQLPKDDDLGWTKVYVYPYKQPKTFTSEQEWLDSL